MRLAEIVETINLSFALELTRSVRERLIALEEVAQTIFDMGKQVIAALAQKCCLFGGKPCETQATAKASALASFPIRCCSPVHHF
jgi:hypothetical protein